MSEAVKGPWFCDANAGTPALPEVLDEFLGVERSCPANPASAHTAGRRARGVLERARERVAAAVNVAPGDVIFTSGGTEAANLAVRGLGDPALPVLLGDIEHPAVRESASQRGLITWEVDTTGAALVTPPPRPVGLIALVHAQSEVGTLQPIDKAVEVARNCDVPAFIDAAQTLGRVPLDPVISAGAVVALSPHKAGGLRGHGALVGHDLHKHLKPLMHGGGQELGMRPGTPSVALAAANALAIEVAVRDQAQRADAMSRNRDAFLRGLRRSECTHQTLTPLAASVPNTIMMCFGGVEGRSLLPALDLAGVHASHGSACSSGSPTPPRVLASMRVEERLARACVRFSFDWFARPEACEHVGAVVGAVVLRLRKNL